MLEGLVDRGDALADAGVVHQQVDPAVPLDGGVDEPLSGLLVDDVALDRQDAVTQLGGERLESVHATGGDHDLGTGRVEDSCEPVAQPARRAGDDRDTTVETEELAEIEVDHGGRR